MTAAELEGIIAALNNIATALHHVAAAIEEHTRCEYPPEAIPRREHPEPQPKERT